MSPRRRSLSLVLCLVAAAAAWWSASPDDAPSERAAAADAARATPAPTNDAQGSQGAAERACAFEPGERWAYTVDATTRAEMDLSALTPLLDLGGASLSAPQDQTASVHFTLELEALARLPDGANIVAAQLHDVGMTTEHAAGFAELSRPFMLRVAEGCGIEAFAWRFDAPDAGTRDQQSLLSELNFWRPDPGEGRATRRATFDFNGYYDARYEAQRDGHIKGAMLTYRQTFAHAQGSEIDLEIASASLDVWRDQTPWFASLDSHKRVRLATEEGIVIGAIESTTRARATTPSGWRAEVDDWRSDAWVWGLLLERPLPAAAVADSAIEGLEDVTTADIIATLEQMIADDPSNAHARLELLVAWLRAHPEAMPEVVALIRRGDVNHAHRLRAVLFGALGLANTPQTRAALMQVLRDEGFNHGNRVDAARALTRAHPLPEGYLDAVVAFAEAPDASAVDRGFMALTVGSIAHHQDDLDPAHARAARASIRRWIDDARSPEERIIALQSAGNAGGDALIDAVAPHLDDPDVGVQRQAARALRGASPEVANPLIEQTYASADARSVRLAALDSALRVSQRHHTPPPPALVQRLINDLAAAQHEAEYNRMVDVIGRAARSGDAAAQQEIAQQINAAMQQPHPNITRLEALGRHHNTTWTAASGRLD